MKSSYTLASLGLATWIVILGTSCSESQEAPRALLPVVVQPPIGNGGVNDLGWVVTLSQFRMLVGDLAFTVEGEVHAQTQSRLRSRIEGSLIPKALAHPGHLAGGEVAGFLAGPYVVDWITQAGRTLGTGNFIAARYNGIDFALPAGLPTLPAKDPLSTASAQLVGTATRAEITIAFSAVLHLDAAGRALGVPLALTVGPGGQSSVGLAAVLVAPVTGESFFRKIDFATLDPQATGQAVIAAGSPEHNLLRRHLAEHLHYQGMGLP